MTPSFSTPTRVIAGLGVRSSLPEEIAGLGRERVVLVGDGGMHRAGLLSEFETLLGERLVAFIPAGVDPTVAEAESATRTARSSGADLVVGVGGGSALSLAKAVGLLLTNPEPLAQYAGAGRASAAPVPTIAIPTTAGSGSEVSNAFVLYEESSDHNIGMRGPGYEPAVALLDGELLLALPEAPFLDATADALSHAFEALWAKGASRFTDTVALEAIRIIRETLPRAVHGRDPEDLQALLEASTLANLGCGNAGLGLVHALSGASSIRVPHGRQNAVLLPVVAAFNRPVVSAQTAAEIDRIEALYAEAGIGAAFREGELPAGAVEAMIAAAESSPFLSNNRRPASREDLRALAAAATAAPASARSPQ